MQSKAYTHGLMWLFRTVPSAYGQDMDILVTDHCHSSLIPPYLLRSESTGFIREAILTKVLSGAILQTV